MEKHVTHGPGGCKTVAVRVLLRKLKLSVEFELKLEVTREERLCLKRVRAREWRGRELTRLRGLLLSLHHWCCHVLQFEVVSFLATPSGSARVVVFCRRNSGQGRSYECNYGLGTTKKRGSIYFVEKLCQSSRPRRGL
ncbi:hypothetical protein CHUAL_010209 [Chamberlinius hualienensis]